MYTLKWLIFCYVDFTSVLKFKRFLDKNFSFSSCGFKISEERENFPHVEFCKGSKNSSNPSAHLSGINSTRTKTADS